MRLPQISGVFLLSIAGGEGFFSPCAGRQVCASRRSAPINAHHQPSSTTYRRWDTSTGGSVGLLRGGGGRSWKTRRQSSSLGLKNAAANDEEAGLGDEASLMPFSKPITLQVSLRSQTANLIERKMSACTQDVPRPRRYKTVSATHSTM